MKIPAEALEPIYLASTDIDPADLKAAATPHVHRIAEEILGKPNVRLSTKSELRFGTKGSISIDTTTSMGGRWYDHERGVGGDIIGLVEDYKDMPFSTACKWIADFIGEGRGIGNHPGSECPQGRSARSCETGEEQANFARSDRVERARLIWREAIAPGNTLVETYLTWRQCWQPFLSDGTAVRFHPSCPAGKERKPTMVALMTDPATGNPVGIHRTPLEPNGLRTASTGQKMALGVAGGSVIRLLDTGGSACFAEGIETTLSGFGLGGFQSAISVINMGNFRKCAAIPGVDYAVIFADNPKSGDEAPKQHPVHAALQYAMWCEAQGQFAQVLAPPEGLSDLNDWVRTSKKSADVQATVPTTTSHGAPQ